MYTRICPVCGGSLEYRRQDLLDRALKTNSPCLSCAVKASHAKDPNRFRGENNPMYGKSALETMTHDEKKKLFASRSERVRGDKNPMYGKPSPIKSGHGIGGTYKGLHFRSLLELAFILQFEQQRKELPQSAERQEFKVQISTGSYFPDFTDGEFIFEIKPKRLLNWKQNPEKFLAATNRFGDKFVVITEDFLPNYRGIRTRLYEIEGLQLHNA